MRELQDLWVTRTPEFEAGHGVAREGQQRNWKHVPNDIDILVTHGPPHGKHDLCFHGKPSIEELMARILTAKPLLHVFGHVHEEERPDSDGTTFGMHLHAISDTEQKTTLSSHFHTDEK